MKTKLLITGSSGFLGSRLAHCYKEKYDLLLPSHSELNISHEEAVKTYMEEHRPEAVIHCAALSNTWYCEQHPEDSHKVNVQGTVRLAKACKLTGAKLVFMSSDQVYNGTPTSGPLKEEDVCQSVNVYGQHKLEAEQRTLRNLPDSVGLRLTWMYDLPDSCLKQNSNLLANLQKARYCRQDSCGNVVGRIIVAFVYLMDDALNLSREYTDGKFRTSQPCTQINRFINDRCRVDRTCFHTSDD